MKKARVPYISDAEECAEKIKAILDEYCSHIEIIYDKVVIIDDDTDEISELQDAVV